MFTGESQKKEKRKESEEYKDKNKLKTLYWNMILATVQKMLYGKRMTLS